MFIAIISALLLTGDTGWLDSIELPVPPSDAPASVEVESDFEDGKENIPLISDDESDFEDGKENIPLSNSTDSFVEVEFFNVPRKYKIPLSHSVESNESGVSEGITGFIVVPSASRVKSLAGIRVDSMGSYLMRGVVVHEGRAGNWSLFSRPIGQGKTRLGVFRSSNGVVPVFSEQECPDFILELTEQSDSSSKEDNSVSAPVPGSAKARQVIADCLVAYVREGDPRTELVISTCNSLKEQGYWVEVRYEHKSSYKPPVVPSYHLYIKGSGFVSIHPLVPESKMELLRNWLRKPAKKKREVRNASPTYKS